MTLDQVIQMADSLKPNAFSAGAKTEWVNECEGMVQTQVMLFAIEEVITYDYASDKDKELLVIAPHSKIYWAYVCAMIDFANGEYDKYANSMQMFNAFFGEYMRWFAKVYRPADTHAGTIEDERFWKGYYLTAYGLAVKHGYKGTESEWVSLVGLHPGRKDNPHKVTAEQVGAYTKTETDGKLAEAVAPVESDVTALEGAVAEKLDKVSSFVRVYPGVYATVDTDGSPQLITATSDLSYIGTGSGYIPLYAAGGQLKTAEPTAANSAANKGYVDDQITEAVTPVEEAVAEKLDKVTESAPIDRVYGVSMAGEQIMLEAHREFNSPGYIPVYNEDGAIKTGTPKKDTDSVNKKYADDKAAEKLDKVSSFVRVYPGVYATVDTDGTPQLITATSDLSYIGAGSGYIPLYATGGQLKTAEPTADDSAANKGYVDGKMTALTNKYELIETITLTEVTEVIERSSEPDGTAYNFKKLLIYMNAALTDKTGACGVELWDGTTLAAKNLAFGSKVTTTSSNYMMELSVEDGILRQTTPETTKTGYLSMLTKTAAETFVGGVKTMDKISKFTLWQFNRYTFAAGTIIKIYGVRA